MPHNKIIVVTLYNRPQYTSETLGALGRCDGINDYKVLIHVDPGNSEVQRLANTWLHMNKEVFTNHARIGCNQNIFGALNHGFRESDYVIIFEDDCLPSWDCLRYFEWAAERYCDDKDVFTVASYRNATEPPEMWWRVHRERWFTPWGWATWRDRWPEMSRTWGIGTTDSWDVIVNRVRGSRCQITPHLARTQNIGAENGQHVPDPDWHRMNQFNAFWSGSVNINEIHPFTE